mmetsp:Transcript_34556/g.55207  ORF Transcript_34556/g.55207 Transcript_34556/m.55207 type:complete len:83 (-) Transcript_34556:395-643(-)
MIRNPQRGPAFFNMMTAYTWHNDQTGSNSTWHQNLETQGPVKLYQLRIQGNSRTQINLQRIVTSGVLSCGCLMNFTQVRNLE